MRLRFILIQFVLFSLDSQENSLTDDASTDLLLPLDLTGSRAVLSGLSFLHAFHRVLKSLHLELPPGPPHRAAGPGGADHGGRRKQCPGERLDVMPWRAGGVRLRSCRLQPAPAALAAAAMTPPWQPWRRHHGHESALHKWSLNRLNSWL